MEDFRMIIDVVFSVLSVELSIFGYNFSLITICLATLILSIAIGFVVKIFGGD